MGKSSPVSHQITDQFQNAKRLHGGIRPVRVDRGHVGVPEVGGDTEVLRLHRHTRRIPAPTSKQRLCEGSVVAFYILEEKYDEISEVADKHKAS